MERPPGQPFDLTPGPVAKLHKGRPDVYDPAWAAAAAANPRLRLPKHAAPVEASEDEDGWLLEATDAEVCALEGWGVWYTLEN